jgi:hypothetical protein
LILGRHPQALQQLFQSEIFQPNWIVRLAQGSLPASGIRRARVATRDRALEKLEETPWLMLVDGPSKPPPHRNLTEIKAFGMRTAREYGSTSIVETL